MNFSIKGEEERRPALIHEFCKFYIENPIYPLYNVEKQEIKERAKQILKRIFWILDADHDGKLNEKEWKNFKSKFNQTFEDEFLLSFINEEMNLKSGITLEEFLKILNELLRRKFVNDVWDLLRNFDYNEDFQLNNELDIV